MSFEISMTLERVNFMASMYRYVLTSEESNSSKHYQRTPVFQNLDGGFYNIAVEDSNGCDNVEANGVSVSVLDYPRQFRPTVNGLAKFWQLKGISPVVIHSLTVVSIVSDSKFSIFSKFYV